MKIGLLALLLAGCATTEAPPDLYFTYLCDDGVLLVIAKLGDWPGGYVQPVGRCIGDLRIIGPAPAGTGT